MAILNTQAPNDINKVLTGKDGGLFNADGVLLASMESYQVQFNYTNAKYTPLGDAKEFEIMQTYGITLVFSEIVIADAELPKAMLDNLKTGGWPKWTFQGRLVNPRTGESEVVVYPDCVPSGAIDLQNVTTGDLVKRSWSMFVNGTPNMTEWFGK